MKKPKALKPNDTVGIIAPSGIFKKSAFLRGVKKIKSWGFNVKYSQDIFNKLGYLAGPDSLRAKQINQMFQDKEVKAIFSANAGYGCLRVINRLNPRTICQNPKIFIGYSDLTVLHSYLNSCHNLVTFYGPIVSEEIHSGMLSQVELRLLSLLYGEKVPFVLASNFGVLNKGNVEGIMVGGNLSCLISTIGTDFEIDTKGKILFLEDVNISVEDLDNMLTHLKLANKLTYITAIIFGQLLDYSGQNISKRSLKKLVDEILDGTDIPIIYNVKSGHGKVNLTLPFGVKVAINTAKRKLVLKEKAVI